ncbi:MAG TPA: thiamine pyrophosphate-dependent enzyme [Planctomycetota bacterium]|nr:thiamine pyrophosphate-dependent enzyme [Planctomycetota bacterium]
MSKQKRTAPRARAAAPAAPAEQAERMPSGAVMERRLAETEYFTPGSVACPGCGGALAMRHFLRAMGPETVVVIPACCWAIIAGQFPYAALTVPTVNCLFAAASAVASGIGAGLRVRGDRGARVMVWVGDGGTYDIGLQSLSGALERNEDMLYVCYDNEAYMNTGIQRSSATPPGAWTTTTPGGKDMAKKNIMEIITAHRVPYAATVSLAFPEDLREKVKKARDIGGARFIHVLAPCPPGWKCQSSETVKLSRLAVDTKLDPLYEVENGLRWRITVEPRNLPVEDFLSRQGRFSNLDANDVRRIQAEVDRNWAVLRRQAEVNPL